MKLYFEKLIEFLTNQKALNFIARTENAFAGLPSLPTSLRNLLVLIIPYLALFGMIVSLLQIMVNLQTLLSGLSYTAFELSTPEKTAIFVSVILQAAGLYLLFRAFKPLKAKQLFGWVLIFWNEVIGAVIALVNAVMLGDYSFSALLVAGTFVAFYLLFNIKDEYEGSGEAA